MANKCFLRQMSFPSYPKRPAFRSLLLGFAVLLASLAPASASAALLVRGRAPLPRFRRAPLASASSLGVADASEVGTRTNGKVIGVDPREGPYTCSGTAIDTPSRSIVLTAGHCVVEEGRVGRHLVFVPAYEHGERPFGTFRVQARLRDAAVAPRRKSRLRRRRAARPARTASGCSPTWSAGAATRPANRASPPSRSSATRRPTPAAKNCGAAARTGSAVDPLTDRFAGPPTMLASCDMAAGSSGGGWLFDGQYVSGVTSYGYAGRPTQLFSPYFGSEVGAFLRSLP